VVVAGPEIIFPVLGLPFPGVPAPPFLGSPRRMSDRRTARRNDDDGGRAMTDSSHSAPTVRPADSIVNGDDRTDLSAGVPPISSEALGIVEAVLEGGPVNLPAELRTHRVSPVADKIKVHHYGGYEHFERDSAGVAGDAPVVFRWTGRTRIAE
jgi:hypothetical protein